MKNILKSSLSLLAFLYGSAAPGAYYYKEATVADAVRIAMFCEEQSVEPSRLMLHLNQKENRWVFVTIELGTEKIKGLALGQTNKAQSQAVIDFLHTDPTIYKLTEVQLRHILTQMNKASITACVLPAETLLRSGMRSIKTNVAEMLNTLTIGSLRFDFYGAARFVNPDNEALCVLNKYYQLTHSQDQQPSSLESMTTKTLLLAKKYQPARSGLLAAYCGDAIVGITGITPSLTSHQKNLACLDKVVVDEGFCNETLTRALLEQITTKAKDLGFDDIEKKV